MNKIQKTVGLIGIGAMASFSFAADIQLPPPVKTGGQPLMQTLAARKSTREFANRELDQQTLSSLLWAANGISRPDGRRTAPTGLNVQDIDIYAVLQSGVYRYDAQANRLIEVATGDLRDAAGRQPFAKSAPLNLVYVQDKARAMKSDEMAGWRFAGIHTGAIMQNVYLFAAQAGLATVARASFDSDALAKALRLSDSQRIILAQTIGYAAEAKAAAPDVVKVTLETSLGDIALELDAEKAPVSVANFVAYVKSGHYDGTIFHRVINGFMIQGGGFTREMVQKQTLAPIRNEAANGLRNLRGTLAMARTMVVDSATCQFFINLKDNAFLDHTAPNPQQFGYAVFGRVTKGMDIVDKIAQVRTGSVGFFQDVPLEAVVIKRAKIEQ